MKNIKDYLHLYIGCRYRLPYLKNDGVLTGRLCHSYVVNDAPVKLILRPLSDMTEGEAIEFCIKEGWGENLSNIVVTDNAIDFTVDGHTTAVSRFTRCRPQMFLWLLSKGFDLFGLIDEGLAIEKVESRKKKET